MELFYGKWRNCHSNLLHFHLEYTQNRQKITSATLLARRQYRTILSAHDSLNINGESVSSLGSITNCIRSSFEHFYVMLRCDLGDGFARQIQSSTATITRLVEARRRDQPSKGYLSIDDAVSGFALVKP